MKILITSQHYAPEPIKVNEIAEELSKRGHDVTALVGVPNYPDGIVPERYRNGKNREETINGVKIIHAPLIPRKNSKIGLAANYFSFAASAKHIAKRLPADYDFIFAYQTSPITMVEPALVARRNSQCPCLIYCCDLWPESMVNMTSKDSKAFKVMGKRSKNIYSAADAIAVTSKPFFEYLHQEHGIPVSLIRYLPQHGDTNLLGMDLRTIDNSAVDFMFAGNMGIASDTDIILKAANLIKDTNGFKIHMVGGGTCLQRDRDYVQENGLSKIVEFYGRRPQSEMPDYYSMADVCLLTLKHTSAIGLTMPAKLQGYMAAGKPVLGAIDGAASEIITQSNCGFCVAASDYEALAERMLAIIHNPQLIRGLGDNGRKYFIEHFTLEKFADDFLAIANEMVRGTYV